jgi:hypothetical protein
MVGEDVTRKDGDSAKRGEFIRKSLELRRR